MPDKLTDSEIVKALERYKNVDDNDITTTSFKTILLKEVYLLINRLKSDCENYRQVAEHQQSVTVQRGFEIKRLKEEVERLNNAIDEQDIEIAQLYKRLDKAKTEAYTDFAESLKKDFDNPHIQKFGLDFVKFLKNVVDNRLKELVGDSNE